MATKDISDFDVVNAIKERQNGADGSNIDVLARMTGQPPKVAQRALERADRRGLIEWGTSLLYAWPTADGERLYQGNGGRWPPRPHNP